MKSGMKNTALAMLALTGLLGAGNLHAQEASDAVKRECREVANSVASMIADYKRRGGKDLENNIRRPSTGWGEQVAVYMIQSATRSESLTQSELATAGYAYCVERRPVE